MGTFDFCFIFYAIGTGYGLATTDFKKVRMGRLIPSLMFGVLLSNILVAVSLLTQLVHSTEMTLPDFKGLSNFLKTAYLVGDITAIMFFEIVYILRMITVTKVVFKNFKGVYVMKLLYLIPIGYSISHLIAVKKYLFRLFEFSKNHLLRVLILFRFTMDGILV